MKQKRALRFVLGVIAWVLLTKHPLIGPWLDKPFTKAADEEKQAIQAIHQIYDTLDKEYYFSTWISLSGMREWAVKWFVESLRDPYTEYFTIDQNQEFQDELQWQEEFEWIGAAVQKKEELVEIQEVFKWTPAAVAGLRPMDGIVEIDWESTKDLTVSEAVKKIRWPKWTTVKLLIYRASEENPQDRVFTVEVTRENVTIPSVAVEVLPLTWTDKKIVYIEIALIGDKTETFLKQEIAALKIDEIDGVVLDLRGNWWGYLPKAVEIVSHFIPKGKVVVTGRYSILPTEQFTSKWYGEFEALPIVVLMDTLTASAWEIIAGALKQHRQAPLIWTTTFWKWSIQTVTDIGEWAWLKYTIWRWYLPDDTNVDKEGIKPDIEIEFDREQYEKKWVDVQKEKAFAEIQKLIK